VKTIEFAFLFMFMWFITSMMTGQIWVWPVVFVGLCVYAVGSSIHEIRTRQRYEEARAIADRLAEEARIAADRYAIAEARAINKLTPEAVALFTNPN
jgi:hypothetical protein